MYRIKSTFVVLLRELGRFPMGSLGCLAINNNACARIQIFLDAHFAKSKEENKFIAFSTSFVNPCELATDFIAMERFSRKVSYDSNSSLCWNLETNVPSEE